MPKPSATKTWHKPKKPLKPLVEGNNRVIGGRNPVREALLDESIAVEKLFLKQGLEERLAGDLRALANERKIPTQVVPVEKLDRLEANLNHQGVALAVAPVKYWDLHEMLSHIAPSIGAVQREKPMLLLMDHIEDPHNFGAILRSAVAAGVKGVVIPDRQMAPLSAVAIKASAGTALQIPISRVTNLADAVLEIKNRGYWVAGLDGDGDDTIWEMDWNEPMALIVGSEGRGMRPRIKQLCDYRVSIPMLGEVESLNASVAAGIALFAMTRVRI